MTEEEGSRHTGESRYPVSESDGRLDPGVRRGNDLNPQWPELETLRTNGTAERHPVRFAYLEALTRRVAAQPEPVRTRLEAKTQELIRELTAPLIDSAAATPDNGANSPLTDLLADIDQHANEQPEAPQLRSIAHFQDTWARLSTEQQLTQTLAQAPANAGPMNSQHLVLRSLQRMHDIAPDYLQGFMSYIDTLIWLESAARPSGGERENKERTGRAGRTSRQ
ncbi:MAG: DUF2894 domain-containing protein [Propionivibrio sp.]